MNRENVLALNVVPDGKEAWLSYDQYQELKRLFEAVDAPVSDQGIVDSRYVQLHLFLTNIAGLPPPLSEFAVHFNALMALSWLFSLPSPWIKRQCGRMN